MEFSFGTNWSNYSRIVGDVLGPLLAAEGVIAFFLESVFLGAHMSAFWIIVANSWMQTPAGYEITQTGRIVLSSFYDAVFNPSTVPRFLHAVMACWMTGAVMIAGIAGYYVRKGLHGEAGTRMLKIGIVLFAVTPLLELGLGHMHAIEVIKQPPVKIAAIEGQYETVRGARLYAFGWVDEKNEKTYGLYIPKFLSFLYNFDFNSEIRGLRAFPREHWPPVNLVFQAYHIMVGIGMLAITLGLPAFGSQRRQPSFRTSSGPPMIRN